MPSPCTTAVSTIGVNHAGGLITGKLPRRDDEAAAATAAAVTTTSATATTTTAASPQADAALATRRLKIALYQPSPSSYDDRLNQQREGRPVKWRDFTCDGTRYELGHVHPRTCEYTQPAKGENPARAYTVEVTFSHHCFTRGLKQDQVPDPAMVYTDARGDERIFDFDRYTLSTNLPAIVARLDQCKCYHTGHGNYFSIQLVDASGATVEYDVFFTVSRSSQKGVLNVFVQSAYVRDAEHMNRPRPNASRRPNLKPIGFHVILFNTLMGKAIKMPK